MMRSMIALTIATLVLPGCGGDDGNVAKQTGNTIGQAATDFVTGVGSGVDQGLEVSVEFSEKASSLGLSKTVSKQLDPGQKGITVYILSATPVKSQLIAKGLNAEGQEVGRSVVDIDLTADDAKYVQFPFESDVDMQRVVKFTIDVKEKAPTATTDTATSASDSVDLLKTEP